MKMDKKRYIAAVSGGPDSMALLNMFSKNIVGVCHVNYHKRKDSDIDTKIVADYCSSHNLTLAIYDVDKSLYKDAKQKNFQALAREIRYEFFVQCAKQFKCNNLLIAHNINDFIETAIMQERRKSLNFFYGIRKETKYKTLNIYRPLLSEFKADLEKYCHDKGIAYAIDSSNALDIYERNRIRKELAKWSKKKMLAKYKAIMARNARQAIVEKQVNSQLASWAKTSYSVNAFKNINPKIMNAVIYVYLKKNKIINVNYNKIKLVRDFIVSKKSNQSLRLETNIKLLKKNKQVKIVHSK
ncbi:MAG: tRNA lysidine(34) synthetase TilS [Mycoplasmoidaceae bacterium]